jgi:hypothetical protein
LRLLVYSESSPKEYVFISLMEIFHNVDIWGISFFENLITFILKLQINQKYLYFLNLSKWSQRNSPLHPNKGPTDSERLNKVGTGSCLRSNETLYVALIQDWKYTLHYFLGTIFGILFDVPFRKMYFCDDWEYFIVISRISCFESFLIIFFNWKLQLFYWLILFFWVFFYLHIW